MARYCFYCGRALSPGEKCQCREKPKPQSGSEESTDQPGQHTTNNKSSDRSPKADREGFFNRSSSTGASSTSSKHTRKTQTEWTKGRSADKFSNARKTKNRSNFQMPDRMAVLTGLAQFARFFTRPADSIRHSAQYANKRKSFLFLLLNCLMGGFLLLVLSRQNQAGVLLQLNIVQAQLRSSFVTGLFLFFQGISLTLCLHGLLIVLTYAGLRWIIRQPVDLIRLVSALGPVNFYASLLLLMTIMAVPGSLIHAALLLAATLTVTMLVLFLSLRQLCQVDEDRLFSLVILILIVFCALASFLFGLTLPLFSTLFDQSIIL